MKYFREFSEKYIIVETFCSSCTVEMNSTSSSERKLLVKYFIKLQSCGSARSQVGWKRGDIFGNI
jgi:hypothetical protein